MLLFTGVKCKERLPGWPSGGKWGRCLNTLRHVFHSDLHMQRTSTSNEISPGPRPSICVIGLQGTASLLEVPQTIGLTQR